MSFSIKLTTSIFLSFSSHLSFYHFIILMTLKVKYLNTSHPNKRDGLLRRDIDALGEKDAVFYPSAHQYYGEWLL